MARIYTNYYGCQAKLFRKNNANSDRFEFNYYYYQTKMKKLLIIFIFLFVLVDGLYSFKAKVIKVHDGDTITVLSNNKEIKVKRIGPAIFYPEEKKIIDKLKRDGKW